MIDKVKTKIENELKQWSERHLIPFEHITVLKTLIIWKLNHLFITLPNPPQELVNKLQKHVCNFIWQSGTDRVRREILIKDYQQGGLKMAHLENYITALKK